MRIARTTQPSPDISFNQEFPRPDYLFNFGDGIRPVNRGNRYRNIDIWETDPAVYISVENDGFKGIRGTPLTDTFNRFDPDWRSFDSWSPANTANFIVSSMIYRSYQNYGSSANIIANLGGMDGGVGWTLYSMSTGIYCRIDNIPMLLTNSPEVGKRYNIVWGRDTLGNCWSWCNGRLTDSNSGAVSALSVTSGIRLEVCGGNSRGCDSTILMLGLYSGDPRPYGKTLSENPWQLFEPELRNRRTVFLPPQVTETTKNWHAAPVVRTTQPRGVVGIDWDNPLSRKLVGASITDQNERTSVRNILARIHPIHETGVNDQGFGPTAGIRVTPTEYGEAISFAGGDYARSIYITPVDDGVDYSTPDLTSLAAFIPFSSSTSADLIRIIDVSFAQPTYVSLVNDVLRAYQGEDQANTITHQNAILFNRLNVVAYRNKHKDSPVFQDLWLNGVKSSTTTSSTGQSNFSANRFAFGYGANPGHSVGYLLNFVWNRVLSEGEIVTLSKNPWQLFKPASRMSYLDKFIAQMRRVFYIT